ncbi:uncharacterized protein [Nicotiana tomentosiformis]|uniref:uncharacterized protein n=1 Tax=Nicotiana tomentosiformis TaxID=4098 RepID=UPI00051C9370|nr:uncharacterized protein LOC104102896 [Nicotiana tomentosiformis]
MNALSKDIAKPALYYKSAKDAWTNLEERFGESNISLYYSIQRAITSTTQGPSDIASYFKLDSKVYFMLIGYEKQREIQSSPSIFSADSSSFLVNTVNPGSSQPTNNRSYTQKVNFEPMKSSLSCKYCIKGGHTVDKCYRLHGFPTDFKFTKNKK